MFWPTWGRLGANLGPTWGPEGGPGEGPEAVKIALRGLRGPRGHMEATWGPVWGRLGGQLGVENDVFSHDLHIYARAVWGRFGANLGPKLTQLRAILDRRFVRL